MYNKGIFATLLIGSLLVSGAMTIGVNTMKVDKVKEVNIAKESLGTVSKVMVYPKWDESELKGPVTEKEVNDFIRSQKIDYVQVETTSNKFKLASEKMTVGEYLDDNVVHVGDTLSTTEHIGYDYSLKSSTVPFYKESYIQSNPKEKANPGDKMKFAVNPNGYSFENINISEKEQKEKTGEIKLNFRVKGPFIKSNSADTSVSYKNGTLSSDEIKEALGKGAYKK